MTGRHTSQSSRAFSLIEMVLSLSLVGLVLASLGSMLAFSMQAAPRPDDPVVRVTDAALPISIMTEEIGSATSIVSLSAASITFEVADRTGDGSPETITYRWDGTPGDSLVREINGGDPQSVLTDVHSLEFEPDTNSYTYEVVTPGSASDYSRELSSDTSHLAKIVALVNSRLVPIDLNEGFFQRVRSDAIPDGALYWTPDYVDVLLEQAISDSNGRVRLEVRLFESGQVSSVSLASRVIHALDLGSENWIRIDIPGELKLDPNDELGVALICIDGNDSVAVRVFQQLVFTGEHAMLRSSDAGLTWSSGLTTRMGYRIRASYFTESGRTSSTEKTVSSIRVTVSPTGLAGTSVVTTVDLPAPVRIAP